jgi:hypothetical protein
MSLDQEAITHQLTLLAQYRRTLAHLLQQAAQYGDEVFAPPQTANGIAEARAAVLRIKADLREGDVEVEDAPSDEAPPQTEPVQQAGGDVVMGDKIGGDKVMGNKRTVDTGGGDYAEGNIDKRQGTFISGGTVQGPVITNNQLREYFSQIITFFEQINQTVGALVSKVYKLRQLNPDPLPLDMAFGYNEVEFLIDDINDEYKEFLLYYGSVKFLIPRSIDSLIGQYKSLLDDMIAIDPGDYRIILPRLRSLSGNIERDMQQHIDSKD